MGSREARDMDAFREEVRAFLAAELTPELRAAGRKTTATHSEIEACKEWHRRLYKRGWIAPAWPVEHGGAGWTPAQRLIFELECALNDAPILFAAGIRNMGPLLIAIGTPEQKQRYLPAILSGEDLWCQGYSEPGAGSDLAALQIRAVSQGNDYIINGMKIWTTGAHLANRMFALVRTRQGAKPQEGITFLMIDMDSPGITVEPIITLAGDHEFNQVFFDNVRVPRTNRIGEDGEGWAVAKQLMRYARSSNTTSGLLRRAFRRVCLQLTAEMKAREPELARKLAAAEIELVGFEALELRLLNAGENEELSSSIMKTLATELHQKITEIGVEAAGIHAAAAPGTKDDAFGLLSEGAYAVEKYLNTRAASIYSGSSEIHRNVIAGHIINLRGNR